ncbi:Gfo/Idh/MocA family protein [Brachybacterium sp. DNPG3]
MTASASPAPSSAARPGDEPAASAVPSSAAPPDIRVGVIGVGRMGADHVERISRRTKGARISVVSDYRRETAEAVAATAPGSRVVDTWQEVVAADDVDAILIASPGAFHREQTLAAIAARKPVLCEKPLAMSPDDAYDVVLAETAAEAATGTAFVSLGFMRRFDAEYAELRDAIAAGELGTPLLLNCKHRNASVLPGFDDTMMVHDSAVHEIDAIGYFLGEPAVSVQTIVPRSTELAPEGLHDPLLFVFRTASGTVVTDELWVSTNAGYEVRTELVGSRGAATIGLGVSRVTTQVAGAGAGVGGGAGVVGGASAGVGGGARGSAGGSWGGGVPLDFRPRFVAAYDAEVQAWIEAIADGTNVAERSATSWDGYLAAAVCAAAERSLTADGDVAVELRDRP